MAEGILAKFAREDEAFQREEQREEELILSALAQEKAGHSSSPLFGSLAPWAPWEFQRCECLERLVKFARARRISLREAGWVHTAIVHAAWEHPELQPPKHKPSKGRPKKSRGILFISQADEVNPYFRDLIEKLETINATRRRQGKKPYSKRRFALALAKAKGGSEDFVASNARTLEVRMSEAGKKMGRNRQTEQNVTEK